MGLEQRELKECNKRCDQKGTWGSSPGGPVVGTQRFHCHGPGSIPGQGTKILQVTWHGQKKKKKKKKKKS